MNIIITIVCIVLIIIATVILYKHFIRTNKNCASCKGCPYAGRCEDYKGEK